MMDKMISYSLDTLTMFADWIVGNSVAFTFAALILTCSLVAVFKQLKD